MSPLVGFALAFSLFLFLALVAFGTWSEASDSGSPEYSASFGKFEGCNTKSGERRSRLGGDREFAVSIPGTARYLDHFLQLGFLDRM